MSRKRAVVVVLGDIGRSPRMCYHAYSLVTQADHDVTMVGYLDSVPHSRIADNEHISIQSIPSPPSFKQLPELAQMLLKLIWTFFTLLFTLLFRVGWSVDVVLMQNPPTIPTAPVCWFVARLKGSLFIIDWHNYMYSVIQHKYKKLRTLSFDQQTSVAETQEVAKEKETVKRRREEKPSVGLNKKKKEKPEKTSSKSFLQRYVETVYKLEGFFGRKADGGLCVTKAMQKNLLNNWNIPSATFYDRPPSWKFGNTTDDHAKHSLLMKLGRLYPAFAANETTNSNIFTEIRNGNVVWKEDRPLLIISSTSWTADEDFYILFDAVLRYNEIARLTIGAAAQNRLPTVCLVITGKGPMQEQYLDKLAQKNMAEVKVVTPWLEAADYPVMLACADIGVSLHTSTSGLDLPMKVVDMFGSEVPVLAKKFACISELVEEKKNGYLFDSSKELAEQLIRLATGFPNHCNELQDLKHNVSSDKLPTWEETWPTCVAAVLTAPRNLALERTLARHPKPESEDEH